MITCNPIQSDCQAVPGKPPRVEVLPNAIPPELKRRKAWLLWRYAFDEKRGKWTKIPYHAKYTARKAKSNDPTTWSTFDAAYTGYEKNQDIDGIGFVPSPNEDIGGVDLDDCIDDTGNISPWAMEIVTLLNSYTEVSPSGHGLRIFLRGNLTGDRKRKGNIEAYDKKQYLTVTGHHVPSSPGGIEERQAQLESFEKKYLSDDKPPDEEIPKSGKSTLTDDEILEKARTANNGEKFSRLWDGDITGYDSKSEARSALLWLLAFWTIRDPEAMDRLFRKSGLYDSKWDERRGQDSLGHHEIMKAIEKQKVTYTSSQDDEGHDEGKKKESQVDILMRLAEQHVQDWFTDQYREAHARFKVGDHFEIWPILGRDFRDWLGGLYYSATGKGCGPDAMRTALATCSAKARFGGSGEHELHVRVAAHDNALWYDLADAGWRSVRITSDEWKIISDTPILFRRLRNTGPQVEPVRGGDIDDVFKLINLKDARARILFKAWLLAAVMPNIPHPAMLFYGPQGSAKTSAFRTVKAILDPGTKKTDTAPRVPSDLVKLLHNQWFSGFDNLSTLPAWVSDCFCRAVTGDGYSERLLYTNNDELVLTFRRVIAMNGINIVATRPDLLDRSILIGLERIDDSERLSEAEVEDRMRQLIPGILGGVLDMIVKILGVRLEIEKRVISLPRMADFALFGCALAEVMGIGAESFLDIYRENMGVQHQEVIDNNPIATSLIKFMEGRDEWIGSPGDLLSSLKTIGEQDFGIEQKSQMWPKASHALVRKINVLKTTLAAVGLIIEQKHTESSRLLRVARNSVRSVSTVSTASGQGLQHDATSDHTVSTVSNSVRINKYCQDSVSPKYNKSLKNDATDDNDAFIPLLPGVGDSIKPIDGKLVKFGVTKDGSTWAEYETPDGYVRTGAVE
jgi:hypothetical protein